MKKLFMIMLCLMSGIALINAQSMRVDGIVIGDTGEPVIGASVLVEGTTTGVTTGVDGRFSLTVNSGAMLKVAFIGYEAVTVPATPNMRVELRTSTTVMDEVVVTGMMQTDKRLFTGATDRLKAEDIKIDGIADVSRALEGRSAGVSVQNVSATFGTAPKIRIRGATSILGDSRPLWVVDGVIIEDVTDVSAADLSSGDAVTMISSAVSGLNSDDIESFQILKDGSATSIYGARAMAGVIVITTKKGRPGQTKVTYTGEFTTRLKPSYNDYNIMNSQDQMGIYQELERKGFLNLAETLRASKSGVYGHMYSLINTYEETGGLYGLANNTQSKNAFLRNYEYMNTDWFDVLFKNSVMMNHSVSISSGTEKSTSYLSMSVMNDPGWYKKSNVDRYTINANSSVKVVKDVTLTLLGNASYRKQKAPGTLSQDTDAVNGEVKRDFDINPFSYAMNTSRTLDPNENYIRNYTSFNILEELDNNYIDLNVLDARFQGELKWNILPGLDVSALGAVRYSSTSQQHHIKDNSNQARAYRAMDDQTIREKNPYLYTNPDDPNSLPVTIMEEGGIFEKREYRMRSTDFRASATYNKIFDDVHIVNLFGGMEVNSTDRSNDWFRGWGMQYNQGEIPFYNYLAFKKSSEENADYYTLANSRRRNVAYFANAIYSYKAKYTIQGTFRYEGTNRLGKSRTARWLPTWNVSGAWNVHEENFFENLSSVLSHLTFKASYSLTADAGPSHITNSTAIINSFIPWRPIAGDRESGLQIKYAGNSDLTYEKKHEFNFGVDMGFLNNRINVAMDVYKRNNFDLLGLTNTQGVSGEITRYANIADMKSHGIEFTLSTRNIDTRNFKWNTDLTFSYTKNKITKLQSDANVMKLIMGTGYTLEGFPVGSLFSIPFAGLDEDGLPTFWFNGTFVDQSNYGELNFQQTDDLDWLEYNGPVDPKYTGGFGNIFTYKNFRLNVFMTYGFGNKIRLNPVFSSRYYDLDATSKEFKNRWMVPGDESSTSIPAIANSRQVQDIRYLARAYNAYNYSTARVAKGDFIRMKEISLSYDFPRDWLSGLQISDLSLKIQATNPFLIYADKKLYGQDPEYYQSGGVSSPLARQFTFTIRIGF